MRFQPTLIILLLLAFFCFMLYPSEWANAQDKSSGTKDLFNGKDLTGWEGDMRFWTVKDGVITGTTTAAQSLNYNTFLILKDTVVNDFEITLEYKMIGNNSGIQYRSKLLDPEKFVVGGYQADIDASLRYTGINYEEKGRAILAERGEIVRFAANGEKKVEGKTGDRDELATKIKKEDWNAYRIVVKGNRLQHYINDHLMSEVIDEQKHVVQSGKPDIAAKEGILALQLHQGPPMVIQFRNIKLQTLTGK